MANGKSSYKKELLCDELKFNWYILLYSDVIDYLICFDAKEVSLLRWHKCHWIFLAICQHENEWYKQLRQRSGSVGLPLNKSEQHICIVAFAGGLYAATGCRNLYGGSLNCQFSDPVQFQENVYRVICAIATGVLQRRRPVVSVTPWTRGGMGRDDRFRSFFRYCEMIMIDHDADVKLMFVWWHLCWWCWCWGWHCDAISMAGIVVTDQSCEAHCPQSVHLCGHRWGSEAALGTDMEVSINGGYPRKDVL